MSHFQSSNLRSVGLGLIFLAFSSAFAAACPTADLEMVLPKLPEPTAEIVVTLRDDGRMLIDAKIQPAGAEGLKSLKKVALANTDALFTINADTDVEYRRVVKVIETLASAKVTNVAFGTLREPEDPKP